MSLPSELKLSFEFKPEIAIRIETALYPEGINTWADTVFDAIKKGDFDLESKAPRFMTFEVGEEGIVLIDVSPGLVPIEQSTAMPA